jgi:hypothetical protein
MDVELPEDILASVTSALPSPAAAAAAAATSFPAQPLSTSFDTFSAAAAAVSASFPGAARGSGTLILALERTAFEESEGGEGAGAEGRRYSEVVQVPVVLYKGERAIDSLGS